MMFLHIVILSAVNSTAVILLFLGVSKETVALVLAISGILEIPFKIANGYLSDRKLMSPMTQQAVYMVITGVAALLCALISGLVG